MPESGREEHLAKAKERALAILDGGSTAAAFDRFAADLEGHPETAGHPAVELGIGLMTIGGLSTREEMRKFIEDFN